MTNTTTARVRAAAAKPAASKTTTPVRKTAAKKAAAAETPRQQRQRRLRAVTEVEPMVPDTEPAGKKKKPVTVTFRGRRMPIVAPNPDQLAIWQRTVDEFGSADFGTMAGDKQLRLVSRGQAVIGSVLKDPADREWLQLQYLDADLVMTESVSILHEAVQKIPTMIEGQAAAAQKTPVARRRK